MFNCFAPIDTTTPPASYELGEAPSGQTIAKPTALGPVANTDTKLLIYGLFQKGRVLAQDGRQRRCQPPESLLAVSIHSPRRSEGRQARRRRLSKHRAESFNPLPPPKRGETLDGTMTRGKSQPLIQFQSTPPAEARGDCIPMPRRASWSIVSIHSPRRSEGRRRRAVTDDLTLSGFNPLPPPKRGETSLSSTLWSASNMLSFNPLPPPKRGETCLSAQQCLTQLA